MRGKDMSNSKNLNLRAGRGVCSVVRKVSDLAERGIADNQKNYAHGNHRNESKFGSETFEFHRKMGKLRIRHGQRLWLLKNMRKSSCGALKNSSLAGIPVPW